MRLGIVACAGIASAGPAAAQDGFDLSGTTRARYEALANQPRAGSRRDDALVSLRTTLLARYTDGPLTLAAELWDSRAYGDRPGTPLTTGEVDTIEPMQAYLNYTASLGRSGTIAVKAGRFTLNVGSRRIIASDDYGNSTNSYAGLHSDLRAGRLSATMIYVLPEQRRPDDIDHLRRNSAGLDHAGFDKVLWGGTAARARALGRMMAEASFYHFGEHDLRDRPTRDRSIDTYGGRLLSAPKAGEADIEVEALHQSGRISASLAPGAARLPVSAWLFHGETGYSMPGPAHLRASIGYDYASGDARGGRYARFDPLFSQRRPDYPVPGLFSAINRANLSSPSARLEVAPSKRWDAFVTYRAMWVAEREDAFATTGVRDPAGRSGRFAGHLIDSRARYWLRPDRLRFEADAILLTKGRFLADAPNAPQGGTTLYGSASLQAFF